MKKLISLALLGFLSSYAHAYYSVMSTGEILPENQYTLMGVSQFVTSDPTGINVSGRFEMGINEDSGFRGQFGVGTTDIFLSGLYKYVPYPDVEGQPAVGMNAGIVYASDAGINEFTIRFEPLVSKKFNMNFGYLIPYASLPIGIQHRTKGRDKNDVAIQIAGGVEIAFENLKGVRFMPELGVDIDNAPNYFSIGAIFDFDEEGFLLAR